MTRRIGIADDLAESRLREALRRGREERVAGGSRGVSYAPQDLTARLRRVAALRTACLELRRSAAGLSASDRQDAFRCALRILRT